MNFTFSLRQILIVLLITLIGVITSVFLHLPLVIGFLPGFLILFQLSAKKGIPYKGILKICWSGINKTKIVILILFLVGFLLPSWYLSGTIDQMVQVALGLISPEHFFLLTFIAALTMSMLLGTTVGTLSAIGVPILGTAMVLHLPVEVAAGALVSGAFVGDRTSPFSSSHQLVSHTVEIPLKKQGKAMLLTTILAIFLCLIFYDVLDYYLSAETVVHSEHLEWSKLSLTKFFPPLILILFVIFRMSIIYAFLSSILSASILAVLDGNAFGKIINALWYGIDGLGGGFIHMYELLLFLALAGAYNGLLEELNVIQPYLDKWLQSSSSLTSDTVKVLTATLIISLIAANQTLPIILTGRAFLPHWSNRYGKEELARVLGDSTMLFPGMVPWSVLAIMCSTIVGVSLVDYLPYALFLWILPFITLGISRLKQLLKNNKKRTAAA
ncbi:Na+/H+ antiporter NhaC family protein [Neobacillus sp. SAB-20_R2A]|uniref:Na+/H+ antiporter NhaC family protein n=1 Tax=Neobacillus sp. SAB-20_R2A TaxID=3120519 RepID=UPI003C6DC73E